MVIPYANAKRKIQYPGRVDKSVLGAFAMQDTPSIERTRDPWIGYFRFRDKTQLPSNCLTFPSINCFMPFRDKIVPRLSSTLLGQPFTPDKSWPIIGHQKRFTTMGGFEIEIRVTKSDDAFKKDIIEILYPNPVTGVLQWYQITENNNPLAAGVHEYYFDSWFDTNLNPAESLNLPRSVWVNGLNVIFSWTGGIAPITAINPGVSVTTTPGTTWRSLGFVPPVIEYISFTPLAGTFVIGEIITGTTSSATARIAAVLPGSLSVEPISGIFVNAETITGGTSGATGKIINILLTPTGSSGNIVINGVVHVVTGGWSTDTLLVTSTAGISVNDIATSQIQADTYASTLAFDVCRQNKNYMFYGSWKSRQLFMSNGFGHDATALITTAQAFQNDLVVDPSPYTGTGSHVYRVTIDGAASNKTTFTGRGANVVIFNTSAYSGGSQNNYEVSVIQRPYNSINAVVTYNTLVGPGFAIGEVITGATSGATALVLSNNGTNQMTIQLLVGQLLVGESVLGFISGSTAFLGSYTKDGTLFLEFYYLGLKNGVQVTSGPLQGPTGVPNNENVVYTLADGITFTITAGTNPSPSATIGYSFPTGPGPYSQYTGALVSGDKWNLSVGTYDTFQWQIDGAAPGVNVHIPITGASQTLSNGVSITFVNKTGHALGDYWEITVNQAITKAWTSFYYTLPVRKPGEGYIYRLSENFWTMAPQEAEMYVNTQYGRWSYIETILSADQQNETVSLTPLKQSSMSKVIFPYMISALDNDLIFVTTDKKLDLIGRKELVQLPQISSLSQPVQLDFDEATFLKGSMEYWNKTLWLTSPQGGVMFCYDEHPENKYWQPPQVVPENGILSIVGNKLITHSNIRNQSFVLFDNTSGDTQNNFAFTVRARRPYDCKGSRWNSKNSNMSFVEGYVTGEPPMVLSVIQDINGSEFPHAIKPVVYTPVDRAPIGSGDIGSHQIGSDIFTPDAYFQEIYEEFNPILSYYFYAMELSCTARNHSYQWLSFEINNVSSNTNNMALKNQKPIELPLA